MIVLGIETSCDETSASVVKDGCELLSVVTASSMDLHAIYGGVVPEIAARSHIESIIPVIDQALEEAFSLSSTKFEELNVEKKLKNEIKNTKNGSTPNTKYHHILRSRNFILVNKLLEEDFLAKVHRTFSPPTPIFDPWSKIDAIAVTYGAGLGGSLLVGVMTARTLAIAKNKPLYAVNHVHGHVAANFLTDVAGPKIGDRRLEKLHPQSSILHLPSSQPAFPMLALIVSGGHSQLVLFRDHFDYTLLGQTQDDAIGEAFDKVAKIIGLPYPGGPSIAHASLSGNSNKYPLPKSKLEGTNANLEKLREQNPKSKVQNPKNYDFSFSGIKTAVLRLAQQEIGEDFTFPSFRIAERLSDAQKCDIAASFQRVAIETVVDKTIAAYEEFQPKSVVIAGGVAANQELRRQLSERLAISIEYTDIKLCTDNGAMIATLGCFMAMNDQQTADPYTLDINPNLSM